VEASSVAAWAGVESGSVVAWAGMDVGRGIGVALASGVGVTFGTASLHPRPMEIIRKIAIRNRVSFFISMPFDGNYLSGWVKSGNQDFVGGETADKVLISGFSL
jgi:hypothetical protein